MSERHEGYDVHAAQSERMQAMAAAAPAPQPRRQSATYRAYHRAVLVCLTQNCPQRDIPAVQHATPMTLAPASEAPSSVTGVLTFTFLPIHCAECGMAMWTKERS